MKSIARKLTVLFSLLFTAYSFAAVNSGNNSVYIDQTNADNSTVTITQTGSGNQVGDRSSLLQPAFLIDGNAMSLTIDQDGMNNTIVGNFIGGDSTANIIQLGSGNLFTLTQGNFGTNSGTMNITKTGDNNTVTFNMATTADTSYYLYNLSITGNNNTLTSTMNSKYIVNDITIAGNSNVYTTVQNGANGSSNAPGHKITSTIIGMNNTVSITQNGTTTPNIINLNVTGNNTSTTIVQH